ncbi:MAG: peptidase M14 [Bacteroidetes bacterium]|nr:peptidase M14 [Bacteroidota bacterium]
MKKVFFLIATILLMHTVKTHSQLQFIDDLFINYSKYKVEQIQQRRFEAKTYFQIIDSLVAAGGEMILKTKLGKSFKGFPISLYKIGNGKIKVLLWSQMHGDEATASQAILDIFNFFIQHKNCTDKECESILDQCTLLFIPLLNPDGMRKFERRNFQEIDINRDALRLQTPEGKILKQVQNDYKPDFGFNLHDQLTTYSVGKTRKPASISLLAPAFNHEKDIDDIRQRAIQMCVLIRETIQKYYPGFVARYDDEFEPRAFGDNIQAWGTSTILIESGGYFNDPEKQEVRKMNFIALMNAFNSIANRSYASLHNEEYFNIPENDKLLFHLLIKNCSVQKENHTYTIDLGINYSERLDSTRNKYIEKYEVVDLGDLSTYASYDTIDVKGLKINIGNVYPEIVTSFEKLKKIDYETLWAEGFTTLIYQGDKFFEEELNVTLRQMISTIKEPLRESQKLLGHSANFYFTDEMGIIKKVISNGQLVFEQ